MERRGVFVVIFQNSMVDSSKYLKCTQTRRKRGSDNDDNDNERGIFVNTQNPQEEIG